jgi:hypothetical protein
VWCEPIRSRADVSPIQQTIIARCSVALYTELSGVGDVGDVQSIDQHAAASVRAILTTSAERQSARRPWSVGRIIPWSLAAVGVLTIGSGLLPLGWFGFADYQIARQAPPPDAPFIPNLRIQSDHYKGGEALAGNVPSNENQRLRKFTTDALGFRWTPEVRPGEPPGVLVFRGCSFVWGGGLSDEETLPSELARQLGVNAYNGARFLDDEETPADVDRLTSSLGSRPTLSVFVHLEQDADVLAWHADTPIDRIGKQLAGSRYDAAAEVAAEVKRSALTWVRLSPVIQLSTRARKAVQNGSILPNVYSKNIAAYATGGGTRMLFETSELERATTVLDDALIRERADFIAFWHEHMLRRGSRMVALLLPDKVSVYGPELGIHGPNFRYLDRLESELARRGIRVVNGRTVLRPYAATDLATGELSFWRDDLHWTPLGVQRIARVTAQALRDEVAASDDGALVR